jgi:hypothetical protein
VSCSYRQCWALPIKVLIIDNYRTFLFYYVLTIIGPADVPIDSCATVEPAVAYALAVVHTL